MGTRRPLDAPPDGRSSWASSDATRRSMQGNRSRDTRPELAVRSAVHALGLRYRVAARPVREVRRTADLVFRGARLAVFIDGCFWHGCPDHFVTPRTNAAYWAAKIGRNRDRDVETDALLTAAGWAVVRVWEHEDPDRGAARVREALTSSHTSRHDPPAALVRLPRGARAAGRRM